ncbi:MAG TPA: membrane protein insertase YidC [Steroidobacteraceae bacterium]|jgi:YidC/Oxa1 family membrane protein insertase|nr:membrane protein insertase YidC [Burkholderiaceae bacterium]HZF27098.1 membrane protein insertase YidC [Steroidobacteraceae bacterium]
MDIQRTILWVIFAMSLFVLWDKWQVSQGRPSLLGSLGGSPPAAEKKVAAPAAPPSPGDVGGVPVASQQGQGPAPAPAAPTPPPQATAAAERVRIETDMVRADIDPTGAILARVELLKQLVAPDWTASGIVGLFTGKKQDPNAHVVLLEWNQNRVYLARTGLTGPGGAKFPNHLTPFTRLEGPTTLAPDQQALEVKFAAEAGGVKVIKTYVFKRGQYDIDVRHEIQNTSGEPVTPSVYLQLVRDGNKPEGESALYYTFTGPAVYTEAHKYQKFSFEDIAKKKENHVTEARDGWIAMIQHYFVSAWVPPQGELREIRSAQDAPNLYSISTVMPLQPIAPGASSSTKAALWVGPQDQHALAALAPGLDLVVDYGWLTTIAKPLYWLLEFLHRLVGNWGWSIILLTIIVKAAFYPLSAASYKSMARMKEVTPRMMKIREQYANDKQKMNLAMMELYKTEKINPLGGCLPIVVQIPVFIALYWVLLASVEMRNAPWILWVHDLATPDPWFILPIAMVATMIVQYKLNPTPPDPVQAKMMAVMPYIFGAMFFFFPAGLVLYWLVNNVLSILQQWYVTRQIAKSKRAG